MALSTKPAGSLSPASSFSPRAPDLDASDAFAGFIGVFGLPSKLSALGVGKDKFSLIGEKAMFSIFT
jgi:maleylacetate reductase